MEKYKIVVGFHGKFDNNLPFIIDTLKAHPAYKCVDTKFVTLPEGSMTVTVLKKKGIMDKIFWALFSIHGK